MYLLDTNVISELRWVRPHGAVVVWLQDVEDSDLHLSTVTIGEIQAGIEILRCWRILALIRQRFNRVRPLLTV